MARPKALKPEQSITLSFPAQDWAWLQSQADDMAIDVSAYLRIMVRQASKKPETFKVNWQVHQPGPDQYPWTADPRYQVKTMDYDAEEPKRSDPAIDDILNDVINNAPVGELPALQGDATPDQSTISVVSIMPRRAGAYEQVKL